MSTYPKGEMMKKRQMYFCFAEVLLPDIQEEKAPIAHFEMVEIKKKRGKKKQEILLEEVDGKTVIEVEGIRTTIEIYERTVLGELKFVTKIERIYPSGARYEEPEHYWGTREHARLDARDWISLSRKTDW